MALLLVLFLLLIPLALFDVGRGMLYPGRHAHYRVWCQQHGITGPVTFAEALRQAEDRPDALIHASALPDRDWHPPANFNRHGGHRLFKRGTSQKRPPSFLRDLLTDVPQPPDLP
jgi:hypothetical protein